MQNFIELKPRKRQRVIDLVQQAGVDVSDWANYENGHKNPGANPKYCYEWAFVEPGVAVVLNLWFDNMREANGTVEHDFKFAGPPADIETNPTRRARRRRMQEAVVLAFKNCLPVRVIVLDGNRRAVDHPQPSRVKARLLDPELWAVIHYEEKTGNALIRRGAFFPADKYSDQFSLNPPSDGMLGERIVTSTVRDRNPEIRQFVLQRSKGKCEYCGNEGFRRPDGSVFLETHHIIPLSENGADSVANVVALCANHHREAHHGLNADSIRAKLLVVTKKAQTRWNMGRTKTIHRYKRKKREKPIPNQA